MSVERNGFLLIAAGAGVVGYILWKQAKGAASHTVPAVSLSPWPQQSSGSAGMTLVSPLPSGPAAPVSAPPQSSGQEVPAQYAIAGMPGSVALVVGGVLYLPGKALTDYMGGTPTWDEASQTWGSNMLGSQAYFRPGARTATVTNWAGTRTVTLQAPPFVGSDDHIYVGAADFTAIWGIQATLSGGIVTVWAVYGGGGGGGLPFHTPN